MSEKSLFWKIKHFRAVLIEPLRPSAAKELAAGYGIMVKKR